LIINKGFHIVKLSSPASPLAHTQSTDRETFLHHRRLLFLEFMSRTEIRIQRSIPGIETEAGVLEARILVN